MGSVYRKHYTRPLWPGAKLVTRGSKTWAEWRDRKGRKRKAEAVPDGKGGWRVRVPTGVYYADYRDAAGVTRVVSTGCKTESGARAVLAELERQAELVRSGVLSHTEAAVAERATEPVETHLADYLAGLEAKGTSPVYRENVRRFLRRLFADCGFLRLSDLDPAPVERWLSARLAEGMSARTRNEYRVVLIGFANWAVRSGRLLRNPFVSLPVADERSDRRRERRALTVDEFRRLVYVARWRPLAERGREPQDKPKRPGKRTSWTYKPLTLDDMPAAVERARDRFADQPETIERLDAEGRERALLYRVLVYTGLRKNEAATLQAGDLHLAGDPPYLKLRATNEKNRRGSVIPLRRDLADAIRAHLAEKHGLSGTESPAIVKFDPQAMMPAKRDTSDARGPSGQSCHEVTGVPGLPADARLFDVPSGLIRIFDRDLAVAGIPKRDEAGLTVDVHSLRHTAATWLSQARVPPKVAQELMRHGSLAMTLGVYTHAGLRDTAEAVELLPVMENVGMGPLTAPGEVAAGD